MAILLFSILCLIIIIVIGYLHHVKSLKVMKFTIELQKLLKRNNIDEDKSKVRERCLFINKMIYNPLYCYCLTNIDQECLKLAGETYCEMREFYDLNDIPLMDIYIEEKLPLVNNK